ncbi:MULTISPECIES: hypothetical protein [unclassified Methylobacterium]|uniref:hypothetical protein n=1 Tax=unclassified Methylobacterium TaxID=2615210 RepID=UPI0011CB5E00|nr:MULTISPECIES: hypothetical protein [unclassified Methylobacterium]TXM98477.1 hypothetical protein FV242_28595 [Methylobacterium sp. WL64]TXN53328.1 hypothetical protein FV241_28590 [Methylobacterium sp. WL2]
MADEKSGAQRILDRIAVSLGTSVSTLYSSSGSEPQQAQQVAELVRSFEAIVDADNRQACLDFVRSIAAREQGT